MNKGPCKEEVVYRGQRIMSDSVIRGQGTHTGVVRPELGS